MSERVHLNYKPTKEEIEELSEREFLFREGYFSAIDDIYSALLDAMLFFPALKDYIENELFDWCYRASTEEEVKPPLIPALKQVTE